ncbi:hypothetical protein TM7_0537 [candidate division TM7 genomosp. GTL1]|nr:hypothetical protein TM7_0537 [candidate division TM7 genomosp. GTL1]
MGQASRIAFVTLVWPNFSVMLVSPLTYAPEAEDVFFGPEFSNIIRRPESWRSSHGLKDAAQFSGRAAIIIGADDTVIPWPVISEMNRALKQHTAHLRMEVIGGVGHQLARWLSENTAFSKDIIRYLAA